MNNDLISRSALKEAVENHFDNLDAYFPSAFIKEIDNSPTLEAYTKDEKEGEYLRGFMDCARLRRLCDMELVAVLDEGSEVSYKDVNGDHIPVIKGGFHFEYREKEKDNGKS